MNIELTRQQREYQILTNLNCNLDCSYCYEKKGRGMNNPDSLKKFLTYMMKNDFEKGYVNVDTKFTLDFIGGESFLYPDLLTEVTKHFLELCCQYGLKNAPMLSVGSNGTLFLKPKVQEYIKRFAGLLYIGLSIDGIKETHDKNRIYADTRKGSYDDIIEGYNWVKTILCNQKVQIKSTYVKDTVHTIFEGVKNLINLGFKHIAFNVVFEDHLTSVDGIILQQQMVKIINYVIENNLENEVQIHPLNIHDVSGLEWLLERAFSPTVALEHNYCGSCVYMRCIGFDDKIYGCNRFMTMYKPEYQIGYLDREKEEIVIFNDAFIEEVKQQHTLFPEECKTCSFNCLCPACAAAPYEEEKVDVKDYLSRKNMCEWTKAVVFAKQYALTKIYKKQLEELQKQNISQNIVTNNNAENQNVTVEELENILQELNQQFEDIQKLIQVTSDETKKDQYRELASVILQDIQNCVQLKEKV